MNGRELFRLLYLQVISFHVGMRVYFLGATPLLFPFIFANMEPEGPTGLSWFSLLVDLNQLPVSLWTAQSCFLIGSIRSFKTASEPYPRRLFRASELFLSGRAAGAVCQCISAVLELGWWVLLAPVGWEAGLAFPVDEWWWGRAVGLGGQHRSLGSLQQELMENITR